MQKRCKGRVGRVEDSSEPERKTENFSPSPNQGSPNPAHLYADVIINYFKSNQQAESTSRKLFLMHPQQSKIKQKFTKSLNQSNWINEREKT